MVRFFFYLLVLTVVFLVGMILGLDKDLGRPFPTEESQYEPVEVVEEDLREEGEDIVIPIVENDHLLTKLASFCEAIVMQFYQIIVKSLYYITKLFI